MCEMAPVVVFVYERVEHVRQLLNSLNKNDYAQQTELFIYSDSYLEDERNKEKVLAVRSYIEKFARKSNFRRVHIQQFEQHKGLAVSVISGVSDVILQYGKIIVLEDDLIVTKSYLRYMNEALEYYKDNDRVWSISGYSLPMHCLKRCKGDVYAGYRGSSWGWATWKDRWDKVDWEVGDYLEFIQSDEKRQKFNRGGEDLSDLLTRQMNGESDSWAIRWNYQQYKENMISIFPVKSQVKNLGCDGSGRNCGRSILRIYDTKTVEFGKQIRFEDCKIDEYIMRKFRRAYSKSLFQRTMLVIDKKIYNITEAIKEYCK